MCSSWPLVEQKIPPFHSIERALIYLPFCHSSDLFIYYSRCQLRRGEESTGSLFIGIKSVKSVKLMKLISLEHRQLLSLAISSSSSSATVTYSLLVKVKLSFRRFFILNLPPGGATVCGVSLALCWGDWNGYNPFATTTTTTTDNVLW